jgi:hypothetical protein
MVFIGTYVVVGLLFDNGTLCEILNLSLAGDN